MAKEPQTHSTGSGSKEPQTMEELLASQERAFTPLKRRQVVEATILKITPKEVLLDLGGKAEGIITGRELEGESVSKLAVGDKIPVTIMQTDTDNDYVICSLQVFSDTSKLTSLSDAFETEEVIEAKVIEERKGGFLVNYNGIRGFLPASQVSLDFIGKQKEMIGASIPVRVIEFDADAPRLIVSQKAVVSEEEKGKRQEFFDTANVGDEVAGKVVAVLPFGIVVNVNGIEGFVHISEIAWERVDNPGSYYKVGDELKGVITGINADEGKITLSAKQLSESPWAQLSQTYTENKPVKGAVTKQTAQGYLVRLENGVIGLVHKNNIKNEADYAEGNEVTCTIESIDAERKRVNLLPVAD